MISFHRESNPSVLVNNFHPSQLEKRFGGQAERPDHFWPPIIPSNDFLLEADKDLIIPENEYRFLVKENS